MNSLLILLVICGLDGTATDATQETSAGNQVPTLDCLSDWTKIGSYCYKQLAQPQPYKQAIDKCWDEGGDLPVLQRQGDATLFYRFCKQHSLEPWLGLDAENTAQQGTSIVAMRNTSVGNTINLVWNWRKGGVFRLGRHAVALNLPPGPNNPHPGVTIDLDETSDLMVLKKIPINSMHPVVCQRSLEKPTPLDIGEECETRVSIGKQSIESLASVTVNPDSCKEFTFAYFADHIVNFANPSAATTFPRYQVKSCEEFEPLIFKRTAELWLQRPECTKRQRVVAAGADQSVAEQPNGNA